MDLIKDLEEIIINQFEKYDFFYNNTEDIHILLRKYLNIIPKIIIPTHRNVFISEDLKSKKVNDLDSVSLRGMNGVHEVFYILLVVLAIANREGARNKHMSTNPGS